MRNTLPSGASQRFVRLIDLLARMLRVAKFSYRECENAGKCRDEEGPLATPSDRDVSADEYRKYDTALLSFMFAAKPNSGITNTVRMRRPQENRDVAL
jgi:hypothetical protein